MTRSRKITDVEQLTHLTPAERQTLRKVTRFYPFLTTDYYLSLIDWNDPEDPLRRIVVPSGKELFDWGRMDPSKEQTFTVAPGLQHKYRQTALMMVTDACGGLCRYCFRKRLFIDGEKREADAPDLDKALDYIETHPEINAVVLSGGDPLTLSTARLTAILERLDRMAHVRTIRIGSKLTSYDPYRILDDPELPRMVERFSRPDRRLYVISHFLHPRELSEPAREGMASLFKAGAQLSNQTPLIRGVNDDAEVLASLFQELAATGITPYYLFQCRPTVGNWTYSVPIEEGIELFYAAQSMCTGIASRVRYAMSHAKGKVEILGKQGERVFFRFHRTPGNEDHHGRIFAYNSVPKAYWLDDYIEAERAALPTWPPRESREQSASG